MPQLSTEPASHGTLLHKNDLLTRDHGDILMIRRQGRCKSAEAN